MQDKDADVLREQRRRKKRVARIKNTIIAVIAGWILLSMILIICLFVRTMSLERKLDQLILNTAMMEEVPQETESEEADVSAETEKRAETELALQSLVQVDDTFNRAEPEDEHKVYLTFDNGPSENTAEILDILAKHDVKATFFVTGKEEEELKGLYRRIVEEGHTIGMRSYSNKYNVIYQSREAFEEDYRKLRDYIQELTGVEPKFYRFPGGSSNPISNVPMNQLIQYLNEQQTIYYDWNVSAGDAASAAYSPEEIVENVTEDVVKYKTSVVLLQDAANKSATVEALDSLIEELQEMGAEILPIDEDTQVIQYVEVEAEGVE